MEDGVLRLLEVYGPWSLVGIGGWAAWLFERKDRQRLIRAIEEQGRVSTEALVKNAEAMTALTGAIRERRGV